MWDAERGVVDGGGVSEGRDGRETGEAGDERGGGDGDEERARGDEDVCDRGAVVDADVFVPGEQFSVVLFRVSVDFVDARDGGGEGGDGALGRLAAGALSLVTSSVLLCGYFSELGQLPLLSLFVLFFVLFTRRLSLLSSQCYVLPFSIFHMLKLIFSDDLRYFSPILQIQGILTIICDLPQFRRNSMKIATKMTDLNENSANFAKLNQEKITEMNGAKDCELESGAVQKNANLVNLENPCNASFLAIVAVHTAENELSKVWQPASLGPPTGVQ